MNDLIAYYKFMAHSSYLIVQVKNEQFTKTPYYSKLNFTVFLHHNMFIRRRDS